MKFDTEKLLCRLEEIYACGEQEDGTHTRMAFSPEDRRGRELFLKYGRELGLCCRTDGAGNLILRLEGEKPELPAILIGSHLDTVPDGGRFDGALGCMAGLGVQEAYVKAGKRPAHPIETVVFTDEEGARFGSGLFGSSAFCGFDPGVMPGERDIYGETREQTMGLLGISAESAARAARRPDTVLCFFELHIEQGARLDRRKLPTGIVTSIAGVDRFEIQVTGQANHAGSTGMADRRDALVSAAAFISRAPGIVRAFGNEYTVATVGTIRVTPCSVNVIPGTCTFSLEVRDQSREVMRSVEKELSGLLAQICRKQGTEYRWENISSHEPSPMTGWVKELLEEAAERSGVSRMLLPSGAFHDSLLMSRVFPTGMIFVPSVGGISHAREEFTRAEDIEKGCRVLLSAVLLADERR